MTAEILSITRFAGHRFGWAAWRFSVLAALALVCFHSGCVERQPTGGGLGIGQPLAQLSLKPLTGDARPVELSDLKGKVVLLDFWGTWCPPCIEEFPHIAFIAAKYKHRRDFVCLPVSCGGDSEKYDELRSGTVEFLQSYKLDLPTYWDPGEYSRAGVAMAAEFTGYPTTLVLDRQGIIRGFFVGYARGEEREIEKCVADQLDKAEPPDAKSGREPRAPLSSPPKKGTGTER